MLLSNGTYVYKGQHSTVCLALSLVYGNQQFLEDDFKGTIERLMRAETF